MELKYDAHLVDEPFEHRLNRTIMELKFLLLYARERTVNGLNRTIMELKLSRITS